MTTATPTTATVDGSPVKFYPLATAWSAPQSCSSYIYRQVNGNLLAWDPFYGLRFDAAARACHAPQVTSWWNQLENVAPSTALGPSFVCPEAYFPAETLVISSSTQEVYCCPSQYTFLVAQPETGGFPSQCVSHVASGQTLSYLSLSISGGSTDVKTTTSIAGTSTLTVYGIPVNGYNFAAQATSTTAAASSGSSARTSGTSARTTGTSASTSTTAAEHAGTATVTADPEPSPELSTATRAGIGVGVAFGVILLLGLLAFLTWHWRRRRRASEPLPVQEIHSQPRAGHQMATDSYNPVSYAQAPVEMNSEAAVHELPTRQKRHELASSAGDELKYAHVYWD